MAGKPVPVGAIVPSVNRVLEPEFVAMAPPDVSLHFARSRYVYRAVEDTSDPLVGMAEGAEMAARQLADADVKAMMFGSTGGSFFAGPNYPNELAERLTMAAGVPVATTSQAVIAALRALEARTVSVVTPYVDLDNQREHQLLIACGFEVLGLVGMNIHDGGAIREVPLERTRAFALEHLDRRADVCFVSCTNLSSAALIAELEQNLGRPVITSNQAAIWYLLSMVGITIRKPGFGRLLESGLRPEGESM